MEHSFIDRYSILPSLVHDLDARAKTIAAVVFCIVVVTTPPHQLLAFIIYAGLLVWIGALARIPLTHILKRAAWVLPFSVMVALGLPFFGGGPKTIILGLEFSTQGLWVLAGAAMKSVLGAAMLVLLVSTTHFASLLAGLRGLRVPALFIDLLALTYRYVFVLIDEAMRLKRAAAARGYRPRWLPQAVIIGRLVGSLFIRSYERAERVYGAMVLRGYTGLIPAAAPLRFRTTDRMVIAAFVPLIIAVRILAR